MARKATDKGKATSKAPAVPYQPTERERLAIDKRAARKVAKPATPVVKVVEQEGGKATLQVTHSDPLTGEALLCEAFGVESSAFASLMVEQLGFLSIVNETISERVLAAHMALVHEIEPRDGIEAMLALQMAAIHMLTMGEAASAYRSKSPQGKEASMNRVNKLGRTFTTQMEALKKHRNKGEQKVVVEHRHYHLAPGSQAVFGDVQAGGGVGVATENGGQSHERTEPVPMRLSERPAMLGLVQADGVPVPGSSHDGQEGLPLPRWEGRRANGAG